MTRICVHQRKNQVSMSDCSKCNGTGWYQYDRNHSKVCDGCCTHFKGWWELTEHYAGYEKGKDNRCCLSGCGMMYRDLERTTDQRTGERDGS